MTRPDSPCVGRCTTTYTESGDKLGDFAEGQWWLTELDAAVANGTNDQKRAVAVVRNLLRTAQAAVEQEPVAYLYCGGQFGGELDEWEIDPEQRQCDKLNERFGALGKKARIPLYTAPQPACQPPSSEQGATHE